MCICVPNAQLCTSMYQIHLKDEFTPISMGYISQNFYNHSTIHIQKNIVWTF